MGRPLVNIAGIRFNNLVAINISDKVRNGKDPLWECKCDCGDTAYATGSDLRRGRTNYCPTCNSKKHRDTPLKALYDNYKNNAKKRDYVFELCIDQFEKLTKSNCHYCNSIPMQIYSKTDMKEGIIYNGIDKYDNSIGYVIYNCVPCCKFCNLAKSVYPVQEFKEWLKRVAISQVNMLVTLEMY